jgi:hypothetical protein
MEPADSSPPLFAAVRESEEPVVDDELAEAN